ncbi:MAG: hypothetical protein D6814_03160 [Calditrichaeota bacterium]|nr:MAG: hypothetical protein D6814_03160 [Calditrichota bacterium]
MPETEARQKTARLLESEAGRVLRLPALIGFDGFVDEIVRLVDKYESPSRFTTISTIQALSERLAHAAGKSTNIEAIVDQIKLGGNGPIMANALANFGLRITYIGNLGHPQIHPVFREFAQKARVYSIAEPGHTDALEFDDGKVMLGKYQSLNEIHYENILKTIGETAFASLWQESRFYALVNWTMVYHMTAIWQALLEHHCQPDPQKIIFFDLADPEKRTEADIKVALETLGHFADFYRVILGCNEKESMEIAEVLGLKNQDHDKAGLQKRAAALRQALGIDTVVIHPRQYAVAANASSVACVDGPYTPQPRISTGGGDHFNAGFCLGALLGFDLQTALLTGVATSGYYVRKAASPTVQQLVDFLKAWRSD